MIDLRVSKNGQMTQVMILYGRSVNLSSDSIQNFLYIDFGALVKHYKFVRALLLMVFNDENLDFC